MSKMKSFAMGLMMGLVGHPLPQVEGKSYLFDPDTGLLVIGRDDGSLDYLFSEADFSLTVTEVQEYA